MTTATHALTARASTAVVLVAIALLAYANRTAAQDQDTKPSTVEVGAGAVSQGSYKAGEYNGLENKGAFGIGNIDLRSSTPFDSASALRWRIKGNDLGLETRSLSAQIGVQGSFRFNFGYDELRRNRSDTFQTPYNGTGTNMLTLPGTWQVPTVAGGSTSNNFVNVASARGLVKPIGDAPYIATATNSPLQGALLTPTAGQKAQVDAAADADVPLFHNVNLSTTRTRFDAGFSFKFDDRWGFDASVRPEHKDGLKPMGSVSRNTGADISTPVADVIDTDTNQVNAGLNFKGKKGFAQASYYGSFFKNNVASMSWQNWASGPTGTGTLNTMSSEPGNTFNQLNLTGGYSLTPTTKLVATGTYGRNTQNDAFLTDATTPVVPVPSLNGLVVSTGFTAKITSRPAKKLNLSAGYKFDDRDNRTPVRIYQYADAGDVPAVNANFPAGPNNPYGAVVAQNANANRPYSRKANVVNVDADLSVAKGQWIKGGYDFERIDRACNGSWIDCADAPTTNDSTLRAEWRANASETVTARIGYAYDARRVPDYNENAFLALVPYAGVVPATATGGASALSFMNANGWNGWGPALGYAPTTGNMNLFFPNNNALANTLYANNNRISELPGMRRYYVADRNRNKVRSLVTWQANEKLSVQSRLDLTKDDYPTSVYGLQNSRGWVFDVDASYLLVEDVTASLFYTYEHQRSITAGNTYTANSNAATLTNGQPGVVGLSGNSCDGYTTLLLRNNSNKLDPCLNWSANMLDAVNTVGLALKAKANDNLDLTGNLILSRSRWDNNVSGGNWANNILDAPGAAPTTIAAWFIPATPLPTVSTNSLELRLGGNYALGKGQSIRVAYAYLRMTSADWAYEGLQFGSLNTVLPSNEQPFNYSVNVIGVSYVLNF
jgi:MtrB/PioB family decaheme-associated outer membrane protein